MPNQFKTCGTGFGTGWTNAAGITGTATFASRVLNQGATSAPLRGTNFGFTIPVTAVISGVQITYIAQADSDGEINVFEMKLLIGGAASGNTKVESAKLTTTFRGYSYGTVSDLWGLALTPADINDPGFGFQISVRNTPFEVAEAQVNNYLIVVTYTDAGGGGGGPSVGGLTAPLDLFLIPTTNGGVTPGSIYTFDPTDFNDIKASYYTWKVEDVVAGRTPTINHIFLSYRDIGRANITLTLFGTNDSQQVVSSTAAVTLGGLATDGVTPLADNKIKTIQVGISLTGQNLQLRMDRAATEGPVSSGPVSITKVRLEGRVETTVE